ncbi:MAG: formylglycine-generating enzyme family protein [Bacteroidales bacterium]|nr:formylglycine-generating enzyme family protein [Bacteroidales bacterium]
MSRNSLYAITLFIALPMAGQSLSETIPDGMVLISGDTFLMGSNANQLSDAFPRHPVTLPSFYMDIYEVTNKQYYDFCMATGHGLPEFWGMGIYKSGLDFPDHPVVGVSHFDATEYAEWAGKRLPSEAEWEYAARGGMEDIAFPFGDKADHSLARYNDPEAEKGPVETGSYTPNGYGLFDMAGNAWEWVSDWYEGDFYKESPEEQPDGPARGSFRVFRGGGWHSGPGCITVHKRNALPQHWVDIAGGFRCAKDVVSPQSDEQEKLSGTERLQ